MKSYTSQDVIQRLIWSIFFTFIPLTLKGISSDPYYFQLNILLMIKTTFETTSFTFTYMEVNSFHLGCFKGLMYSIVVITAVNISEHLHTHPMFHLQTRLDIHIVKYNTTTFWCLPIHIPVLSLANLLPGSLSMLLFVFIVIVIVIAGFCIWNKPSNGTKGIPFANRMLV